MNWQSVRLELSSTGDFPAGSVSRAFIIRLPLNDRDEVDEETLRRTPTKATFRRHWASDPDEMGFIVKADGRWSMRCDGKDRTLELDSRRIRLGAELSVVEPDGKVLPFKIASVR